MLGKKQSRFGGIAASGVPWGSRSWRVPAPQKGGHALEVPTGLRLGPHRDQGGGGNSHIAHPDGKSAASFGGCEAEREAGGQATPPEQRTPRAHDSKAPSPMRESLSLRSTRPGPAALRFTTR